MSTSKSLEETSKLAEKAAENLRKGGVLCLYGEIGAGKTTFTKYLTKHLGIDDFKVKSPTYTYIRKYITPDHRDIYHIDLYRLENPDHILLQEIHELMEDPENIIIIEWADRLNITDQSRDTMHITFKYAGENAREITEISY